MLNRLSVPHFLSRALCFASVAMLACEQPLPPGFEAGDDEEESEESDSDETEESTSEDDSTEESSDTDPDTETDSEEETSDTDDEPQPNAFEDTLYPLADGATWTYLAKTSSGQVLGMEEVEMVEIEWEGQQAFLQSDSPSAQGKWTEAVLMRIGEDEVFRVHKEIQTPQGTQTIVDYDPGFVRANDAWSEVDQFQQYEYTRTQTDGDGLNESIEPRGHAYTVLAVGEEVTVPAGTFDTIKIERIRTAGTNVGERVIFWYARGVGKVKEDRPAEQKLEELVSASIPDGVELP